MKKVVAKIKEVLAPKFKTKEELNQEYSSLCVKLGDLTFKKYQSELTMAQIIKQMAELNQEAMKQKKSEETK